MYTLLLGRSILKQMKKFKDFVFIIFLFYFCSSNYKLYTHAILEYSEPARRAILYNSPNKIVLTFNEEIEETFAKIKIKNESDKLILNQNNMLKVKNDKNSVYVNIPSLLSGVYFIEYEVISVDGHKVKGRYKFTIQDNK